MAEIYGLFSGSDWIVRYVGETAGSREDRLREHIKYAGGELRSWFHDEWKKGYPICSALLQHCEFHERFRIETEWINRFPMLLNKRKYPYWYWGRRFAPTVPAIIEHRRRFRYNVGGFRGVHYDVQTDRYFVLIYTGHGCVWALGDEQPGLTASQGGNIWFWDRTSALLARDKQRWHKSTQYLPGVESEF